MDLKRPFKRKSTLERFLDTVGDQLEAVTDAKPDLSAVRSGKAVKTGLIAAGSFAGLTAGSAVVSSLRHRIDRGRAHS
jgi:hypothetical protein